MAGQPPQEETDGVSVYLLRSSRATLAPGEAVELVLRPLHASPAGRAAQRAWSWPPGWWRTSRR